VIRNYVEREIHMLKDEVKKKCKMVVIIV